MNTITPAGLQRQLELNPGLLLLDVRTPGEFASIRVPQAVNAPLSDLRADSWPDQDAIYLLCQRGSRAATAAEKIGDRAIVVEGGIENWIASGLPVRRGRGAIDLERQVRIGAGTLVLVGIVLAKFVNPRFLGLSAFVGGGLVFAGVSGWCGMALLLAKLPWNARR
jgi:rhodanese-related sulfurtransferase